MKPPDQSETATHLSGSGTNRAFYLQRLPREYYQADSVVHWTMPIANRGTGWLDDSFHVHFREVLLHAAAREGLFCPTYCLMPDHIHLVWMGMRRETDQKNGMKFLREHLTPQLRPCRFQHQAHDHVLRTEQRKRNAFAKVCFYIMDNARKKGLVEHPKEWQFCGAVIPGHASAGGRFLAEVVETLCGGTYSRRWKDHEAAILSCSSGRESAQTLQYARAIEIDRRNSEPTHVGCYKC